MGEKIIHIIKVITGQDYRELKGEWEQQNRLIDELTVELNRAYKKNKMMKSQIYNLTKNQDPYKKKGKKKC